ncbi:MAG TPA: hypothetical protein VGQ53_21415, partial [Chitinophagaceae bacterium]|nr:hypothetical protein [Chitinophagaceae bacterium]
IIISDSLFVGNKTGFLPTDDFKPFQNNNSFLAEFVTLCNNQFMEVKHNEANILGYAMGEAGMIIGNIGPTDDRFRLDVKFNRQRVDPSLIPVT